MEEGNLRCDANISLKPHGAQKLGTRVEIKNLNSFKNVQKALEYEIKRQSGILSSGNQVVQETRLFDADRGVTESMRTKEEAHDYRYFPEPDLLPLKIDSAYIEKVNNTIPELPRKKRERFQSEFGLSHADSITLTEERDLAEYFEEAAKSSGNVRQAANWILRDLLKNLKESGTEVRDAPVQPPQIAGLVKMVDEGKISGNQGKDVFAAMWKTGKPAEAIVSETGMTQISGEEEIAKFVDDVISRNPDIVNRYRNGELKLLGVLVGEIMKISRGKANPSLVNQVLKSKLNPESE
jgi:aspartyl-tRNA(Asn)/glutamyl-tRNA(Gln) amidotransferase subunit B